MMPKKKKKVTVEELNKRIEDLDGKWKRALADYQNLEKRVESQRQQHARMASVALIDKLLPVLDDLERASTHVEDAGIRMIVKQFKEVLVSEGVERIEVVGLEFDPSMMDCAEIVNGEKNRVITEVLPGYKLDETVIRPAKVEVGNGKDK